MADQPLALQAAGRAPRHLATCALAASLAALSIAGAATALAKQSCNVAAGHQGYWSWRMIDGRKCWYEGKPMLARSELEWPAQTSLQPDPGEVPAKRAAEKHGNPMDAQAYAPDTSGTFEALWRARIENR